jgi:hypothetical protein
LSNKASVDKKAKDLVERHEKFVKYLQAFLNQITEEELMKILSTQEIFHHDNTSSSNSQNLTSNTRFD